MEPLVPLLIALPLLGAALLMILQTVLPRSWADGFAIMAAGGVAVLGGVLLRETAETPLVYWLGGWEPRDGIAVGIALFVDPFSAGIATLVGLLGTASFIFAWHYFDSVGKMFHALMLVFIAAMVGFCLSGDIFTLFVFFELMSVAAYVLTGYKTEESALDGCLNFAVTNSIGAFFILYGICLLYGRTGALNLAQIGRALGDGPADGLILIAFLLIATGLFVKGALVPFHFWLADAHAVAPTPVCVLFSGIMVELGLYGFARIYWTVFDGPMTGQQAAVRTVLIIAGVVTALTGGMMCLLQRHVKRLLAFSTISHAGVLLVGLALLNPQGSAGASIYLIGHGLVKGALFLCVGLLLHRYHDVDEISLRGKGRELPMTGVIMLLAGLGLAGFPPFGTLFGKSLIEEAAQEPHYGWVSTVLFLSSALTGGAVLRAAGRIFLGWGLSAEEEASGPTEQEKPETKEARRRMHWTMVAPPAMLVAFAALIGLAPNLDEQAMAAAARFHDRSSYAGLTLEGMAPAPAPILFSSRSGSNIGTGLLSVTAAVALAMLELFRNRLPNRMDKRIRRMLKPAVLVLNGWHSGHVGDYVVWLMIGTTLLGALWLVTVQLI